MRFVVMDSMGCHVAAGLHWDEMEPKEVMDSRPAAGKSVHFVPAGSVPVLTVFEKPNRWLDSWPENDKKEETKWALVSCLLTDHPNGRKYRPGHLRL